MGSPKALLELDDEPLLTHVARAVTPHCDELVLSVGTTDVAPPEHVEALREAILRAGAPTPRVVRDALPHRGPVGGLAAALAVARGAWAFVCGCDSPLLRPELVAGLFGDASPEIDVLLPVVDGRAEPLLALYRTATMGPHFARQLAAGGGSPLARIDEVRVRRLQDATLDALDPTGASFVNVNEPRDVERARRLR